MKFGYDTLWLAEHHFQREGYGGIPNIPMLAVYLAQHAGHPTGGNPANHRVVWPRRVATI